MSRWRIGGVAAAGLVCALQALAQSQHAMRPASAQAAQLATLAWWLFGVGAVVLAGVTAVLLAAVLRSRRGGERALSPAGGRRLVLAGGVLLPLAAAASLLGASIAIDRDTGPAAAPADALPIEVIGHRWWWEVHYLDARGQHRIATTANEIRVPVGRAVRATLKSDDVIHSFWAPNLQGKADMVPGRVNAVWFRAEREGVWRGQCAEYCGTQHAWMAFVVVAEPAAAFDAWLARQAAPADEPATERARAGKAVFERSACVMCHTVRGTTAGGKVAPDLTRVASRLTLAAGRLPNGRGPLAAWIADPQHAKPGSLMPPTPLSGDDLDALLDYLETLR